jgi:hypothetical protein
MYITARSQRLTRSLSRSIFHICPLRISTFMDRQGLGVCMRRWSPQPPPPLFDDPQENVSVCVYVCAAAPPCSNKVARIIVYVCDSPPPTRFIFCGSIRWKSVRPSVSPPNWRVVGAFSGRLSAHFFFVMVNQQTHFIPCECKGGS